MKRLLMAASIGTILVGAYSYVYACNEAASKKSPDTAKAPKAVTWYAADASAATTHVLTIDDKVTVCKTVESVAPIAIEVNVPGEALKIGRVIHIRGSAVQHAEADDTPVDTVKKSVRVAATLGRALVTTVGAVWSSLIDAAVSATASLV